MHTMHAILCVPSHNVISYLSHARRNWKDEETGTKKGGERKKEPGAKKGTKKQRYVWSVRLASDRLWYFVWRKGTDFTVTQHVVGQVSGMMTLAHRRRR